MISAIDDDASLWSRRKQKAFLSGRKQTPSLSYRKVSISLPLSQQMDLAAAYCTIFLQKMARQTALHWPRCQHRTKTNMIKQDKEYSI